MSSYSFSLKKEEPLNKWLYSGLVINQIISENTSFNGEVNSTEKYMEVEYPVRNQFLESIKGVNYPEKGCFSQIYCGFENSRVDFSTFLTTPHLIKTYLASNIYSQQEQVVDFLLTTCGRAIVWANGELIYDFQPYSRNHGSSIEIKIGLLKGKNEIRVYMDDLDERDVNFFVEMRLLSDVNLEVELPLNYDSKKLTESIEFLESLYLDRDYYSSGDIFINSDKYENFADVEIRYDDPLFSMLNDGSGGNITDFDREKIFSNMTNYQIKIGDVETLPTSGLSELFTCINLPDGKFIYKKFVFTSYDEKKLSSFNGDTLESRKNKALKIFSNLPLNDLNCAISALYLGSEYTQHIKEQLTPAFMMIKTRGDCADFMFTPLLSYCLNKKNNVPEVFIKKIRELALNFRYWIDEPGNDVMWYFSENHSLLFHTCQYFSGFLFQEETFSTSGRRGIEQYKIGKKRLEDWFEQFRKVGFSEWNSSTYLPIDLIGFFSLYNSAPDKEIRSLAKDALDFTFKIIAVNYHGGLLASTFGRTYEHDLKAMKLGEISNVFSIAWKAGYFNYALRASALFCLSDYIPPNELLPLIFMNDREYFTITYIQGSSKVETYIYKCKEYSLASAINYNIFQEGHQQHLMNISLGNDGTILWLNNPGETTHSGENRPSYWAGNGICPKIQQYKNIMILEYRLQEAKVKKVHLYVPYWNLSEIDCSDDNWLFIRKDTTYLALWFSNGYSYEKNGDTRNREVYFEGLECTIITKLSNENEVQSFDNFKRLQLRSIQNSKEICDFQWGTITWDNNLLVNAKEVNNESSYEIKIKKKQFNKKG